jgi:hypothetical protein
MIAEFLKYTISLVLKGLSKLEYSDHELTDLKMKDKNNHKNDDMNNNINKHQKSLCIYTNRDKNEFAIGLNDDEDFKVMTKVSEFILDLLMRSIGYLMTKTKYTGSRH